LVLVKLLNTQFPNTSIRGVLVVEA